MDVLQNQLKSKFDNVICENCHSLLSVCLDVFCKSQRIFCNACLEQKKEIDLESDNQTQGLFKPYLEQNSHKKHEQQVFCIAQLLDMQKKETIKFQSHQLDEYPAIQEQKEIYLNLMKDIDNFEKQVSHELKILRSNINEKYSLISSSFDQYVQIDVDQLQNILLQYREEYKIAFEQKVQEYVKKLMHPIHLNFAVLKSNLENVKETALNHIKTIANQVKLQNKVDVIDLLDQKWNSSIHDMTIYKNCFVLCGEALRLYTPSSNQNKLQKSFDFNINDTIRCVQVSRDGSILAAGGNGKLILFNTENMKIIFNQVNSASSVQYYSVDISPDNKYFAFSVKNKKTSNQVFIFDISNVHTNPKLKQVLADHNSLILSTKFSNDGKFLVSSGCDYKIIVYALDEEAQEFKKVQVLRDNDDIVNEVSLSQDSKTMASVSSDGKCFIYSRRCDEAQMQEENLEIQKTIQIQKDLERLNQVKYTNTIEEEEKKQDLQQNQNTQNNLLMNRIHSNPFLAQSLIEDQNYIKYRLENNQSQVEQAIQKSKEENVIYENFEDVFELKGCFQMVGKKSINSVDINKSGNFMALSTGEDVLLYDISQKNNPHLLSCITSQSIAVINRVKFSQYENSLYTIDQSGNLYNFKF
ncbi:hypothetical protein ABPG72_018278 [Tetrahymena utriculariae]